MYRNQPLIPEASTWEWLQRLQQHNDHPCVLAVTTCHDSILCFIAEHLTPETLVMCVPVLSFRGHEGLRAMVNTFGGLSFQATHLHFRMGDEIINNAVLNSGGSMRTMWCCVPHRAT